MYSCQQTFGGLLISCEQSSVGWAYSFRDSSGVRLNSCQKVAHGSPDSSLVYKLTPTVAHASLVSSLVYKLTPTVAHASLDSSLTYKLTPTVAHASLDSSLAYKIVSTIAQVNAFLLWWRIYTPMIAAKIIQICIQMLQRLTNQRQGRSLWLV